MGRIYIHCSYETNENTTHWCYCMNDTLYCLSFSPRSSPCWMLSTFFQWDHCTYKVGLAAHFPPHIRHTTPSHRETPSTHNVDLWWRGQILCRGYPGKRMKHLSRQFRHQTRNHQLDIRHPRSQNSTAENMRYALNVTWDNFSKYDLLLGVLFSLMSVSFRHSFFNSFFFSLFLFIIFSFILSFSSVLYLRLFFTFCHHHVHHYLCSYLCSMQWCC